METSGFKFMSFICDLSQVRRSDLVYGPRENATNRIRNFANGGLSLFGQNIYLLWHRAPSVGSNVDSMFMGTPFMVGSAKKKYT